MTNQDLDNLRTSYEALGHFLKDPANNSCDIQWSHLRGDKWTTCDDGYLTWDLQSYKYRLKPTPKLIPFTAETFRQVRDEWFFHKGDRNVFYKVLNYRPDFVQLVYNDIKANLTYDVLLEHYLIDDGSSGRPAGVEEGQA